MTPIRITAPLVQVGNVQLPHGLHISLPDDIAKALEAEGSAEILPEDLFAALSHAHVQPYLPPTPQTRKARR